MKEINGRFAQSHQPIKSKNPNYGIETKKTPYSSFTHQASYNSKHVEQTNLAIVWLNKKDFHSCQGSNRYQPSNILVIRVNATTFEKYKKVKKDLSQVEYYNCYK